MAKRQPKYLALEEIVIPSQTFERGTHRDFQFAPSRIVSLADATYDTEMHIGNSHAQMPKLAEVDYKGVKFINLYILWQATVAIDLAYMIWSYCSKYVSPRPVSFL